MKMACTRRPAKLRRPPLFPYTTQRHVQTHFGYTDDYMPLRLRRIPATLTTNALLVSPTAHLVAGASRVETARDAIPGHHRAVVLRPDGV